MRNLLCLLPVRAKASFTVGAVAAFVLLLGGLAHAPTAAADHGVYFEYVDGGYPGDYAYVGVWTHPGGRCSITYRTPLGNVSTARGLYDKYADRDGWVDWEWFIGTSTRSGTGRVSVSCNPGGFNSAPIEIF